MDKTNLDEIKNDSTIDNSRLEELMMEDISPKMQNEFLRILKDSRLFLPVDFGPDAFKDIENTEPGDEIEGPRGFSIQFLTDSDGNKAVPLFTSEEMMKKAGAITSVIVFYMSDLADMLKQTDKYSIVSINPLTEYDLNMPIEAFLSLFDSENKFEIKYVRNDLLKSLLNQKDLSHDELAGELLSSVMIVGCVDNDDGTNFVLIWNKDNEAFMPLFTDLDEFEKIFDNHKEDIYPQAYHFKDLMKVIGENVVINPASESLILDMGMFKS